MGELDEVRQRDFGGEADEFVVGRMHAEDGRRLRGDGVLVIAQVRLVGGADLDQRRARGGHDVGQPERAADFDQLSTGDDDLPSTGDGVEDKHGGGGVVVDDGGGRSTGETLEQPFDALVATGAFARLDVHLKNGIAGQLGADLVEGPGGQDRTSQGGVEDDPGGVDGSTEMGTGGGVDKVKRPGERPGVERFGRLRGTASPKEALTGFVEGGAHSVDEKDVGNGSDELSEGIGAEEGVNGREPTKNGLVRAGHTEDLQRDHRGLSG